MTPERIALVQDTFTTLVPRADEVAALFYDTLFRIAPNVREMFGSDMAAQGKKLMNTLSLAVQNLDRFADLEPALRLLAERHVDYGVRDEHYDLVGAALLRTLESGLGPAFTDDVEAAWTETYFAIAETMRRAAARAGPTRGAAAARRS